LEKYTDLYDFAPIGYFSLDQEGVIHEVNLTGAAMLGVARSRLLHQRLPHFVASDSQSVFRAFLDRMFAKAGKHVCEAALIKKGDATFWASLHGASTSSDDGRRKWYRVAVSDITYLKQGEEAQRRMEALAISNRDLTREIARRQRVEKALRQSEHNSRELLQQSHQMQEQLRRLSRQVLSAQEEERKKISRELHDVIAQTLTSINVRLANLKRDAKENASGLERSIARTQQLVERSVNIVHRFARELRPTVLDDLGLIPALHTFMKSFREETGVQVSLSAFADVERVNGDKRTVLYRVAQEALANVARHARASRAEVKIQKRDGAVCMKIKDNGKGFQQGRLLRAKKQNRLGLLGMQERLEMVGGKVSVSSAPGKGTTVLVELPLTDRPLAGGRSRANDVH
jgi:PAS domain S-box-containing protein